MALIQKLEATILDRHRVHEEITGSFAVFEVDGKTYLQISTYGSTNRQIPDKVSQVIQFGPGGIEQLKAILSKLR
jgi:hypothetical protein